jgi:hypothetical protein
MQKNMMKKLTELSAFVENQENADQPEPLTLSQYAEFIGNIPLPTGQQRENFAGFVASAHSWYKHLPLSLPSVPFYFFIDKHAGCDCVLLEDGKIVTTKREKCGFHYSAMPTDEYRTRFGHLNFSCRAGMMVVLMNEGPLTVPRDKMIKIPGDDGRMHGLPMEIVEAGVVCLNAAIHPLCASNDWWDRCGCESPLNWPEESGGKAALEKIFARCEVMRQPGFKRQPFQLDEELFKQDPVLAGHLAGNDLVLRGLFTPERKRQHAEIIKAINRVCDLISRKAALQN